MTFQSESDDEEHDAEELRPLQIESGTLPSRPNSRFTEILTSIYAYLCFLLTPRLRICIGLSAVVMFGVMWGSRHNLYKNIKTDYSKSQSYTNLNPGSVDYWCLGKKKNDFCSCDNPLGPLDRMEKIGWQKAHKKNMKEIKFRTKTMLEEIDVVFLGDDLIEEWNGRWQGMENAMFDRTKEIYDMYLSNDDGGSFTSIPLGIAGDTSPNLLWRIINGELPTQLTPHILWINIGSNDILQMRCSSEITLMGILNIVQGVQKMKPNSTIVVGGLLPIVTKHKMSPSLWPVIRDINSNLIRFCDTKENVEFFDMADLVVVEHAKGVVDVNSEMYTEFGKISAEGHIVLAKAISNKVKSIVDADSHV